MGTALRAALCQSPHNIYLHIHDSSKLEQEYSLQEACVIHARANSQEEVMTLRATSSGAALHPDMSKQYTQQQSKVCIQTFALLYIAAFPCIPNCLGIMDQLITGNYVIKFEKNSFRVQLSARGYSNLLCLGAAEGAGKGR